MEQGHAVPKRIRVTEGSCWQCRDRRVKCDTQKPACGRCAFKGVECDYSKVRLRWGNQSALRGSVAGPSNPTLGLDTQALSGRDAGGQWQVMYFAKQILPRFSLSEKEAESNLATLTQDHVLANAVNAIAQTHMHMRNLAISHDTVRDVVHARTIAIRSFRERVQQSSQYSPRIFHANVLLCMLDGILEPQTDCAATDIHYYGGKALIQRSNSLGILARERSGLPSLLLTVFSTVDLTHAILSGFSPLFSPEFWKNLAGVEAWWTGLGNDTAFLELMALLARMALIAHETYTSGNLPEMKVVLSLQLSIERSTDLENTDRIAGDPSPSEMEDIAFFAAYRSVAGIYMYRVLCGLHITDDLVQQCVTKGLRAMIETSWTRKHAHCLLFPLLVIGTHCLEANGRNATLQLIEVSMSYLCFGSLRELKTFLTTVWQGQCDTSSWWTQFHSIASKAFIF